ncbi:MAG: UDP-glucose 4-epimerase GalE [Polynucleobacter sp. 17-46-58]|nr:MAG: UDP-glucose 4-epimerase GalE [Polynucleobacter sp. 35-46-207]OZA39938.1 MAG: UDP-glucose 4-epimerase GalE [Polynucleobacter sp. 17-46-58]OZB47724.1 MAG: UDP-glucose 4-epimerase GalE [Polynucleobacter sp. 39-45-136]HQS60831.1 UDP-glucose 4-epimerase GalE [Polynucleobacter sp.]HQT42192.1 UDP-glucose 4-epimerase GalE [Polynucleobacter sp.]
MNILLTGGMGYIGSHTVVSLAEAGHSVHIYDNLCNSNSQVLSRIKQITPKNIGFTEGDVRDTAMLTNVLKNQGINAVIHLAGLKAVGESSQKPIEYYANNVQGSISLIEAMQKNDIKTLVFSSSATVYGDPLYLPYDEGHPTSPTNPYGRNKLQVEEMLRDLSASDKEWRIACLRYFNSVGAHKSGLIGEDPNGIPNNLMPVIGQVVNGKLSVLNVFGDDYETHDGTGKRDYIHVMDLAEGHLAALNWLMNNPGCHTFNLGSGISYSVLDLLHRFEHVSGQKIPYQVVARRPGDLPEYFAKANKAKEMLHWETKRGLTEICDSSWLWIKNCKIH